MAFYYYSQPGMSPLGAMGQMQAYLTTYGQFYPKSEDFTSGSFFGWPWTQLDVLGQTANCLTGTTSTAVDDLQNEVLQAPPTASKKRRA